MATATRFGDQGDAGFAPGTIAPAEGNTSGANGANGAGHVAPPFRAAGVSTEEENAAGLKPGATQDQALGANNENLEDAKPRVVAALRELVQQFRQEGIVARRHEIKRIRQARLFWQGLQYAWWNPTDMQWHLPWDSKSQDDNSLEEMPRYQFVTNFYQGFGLSFIALISQDVPATRFYPQSAQNEEDISAAKAASEAAALIEQNNKVQQLLTGVGYYLWTDGKIGGYVRFVADGQRFGFHDETVVEEAHVKLGEDAYVCSACGTETPVPENVRAPVRGPQQARGEEFGAPLVEPSPQNGSQQAAPLQPNIAAAPNFVNATICAHCGAPLTDADLRPAPSVAVPRVVGTRRVPNGQEVISIIGGLELNTPVWANEMHEYPYLQWQMEVHRAKLKASYPHAAEKIETGAPGDAEDIYARASRIAVSQGLPVTHPGDALTSLVTFSRTWIRPWAFYAIEDKQVREELLALFPDGCYCAFAGDTYCESRNETMDDHWRVMHAMPGDGQNRPSVGDSLVQVQERYNTLSNIQAETYEYGIPPIYADTQVLDFDALANQVAEPAAHYPARARPGQPLAAGFFQPAPAQVPPDMIQHQRELMGPTAQFLTGLFPAVFGGEMSSQKTAAGYAIARDQALGRLGLVWRRLKQFYADLMLLGVDCFRKNRPEDAEIPFLGADGAFESKWIRLADLKGNIQAHPEADEQYPRLKSQQRAVLQQLMASNDPMIQSTLSDPANLTFIKSAIGLTELVVPGEDSRNKQLREIQRLLAAAPIVLHTGAASSALTAEASDAPNVGAPLGAPLDGASPALGAQQAAPLQIAGSTPSHEIVLPSIPIDDLLDDHAVEFGECRRWANSDAGQTARAQNPLGFANVRAHALAHLRALANAKPLMTTDPRLGGQTQSPRAGGK
jgi:hypothetical protein